MSAALGAGRPRWRGGVERLASMRLSRMAGDGSHGPPASGAPIALELFTESRQRLGMLEVFRCVDVKKRIEWVTRPRRIRNMIPSRPRTNFSEPLVNEGVVQFFTQAHRPQSMERVHAIIALRGAKNGVVVGASVMQPGDEIAGKKRRVSGGSCEPRDVSPVDYHPIERRANSCEGAHISGQGIR